MNPNTLQSAFSRLFALSWTAMEYIMSCNKPGHLSGLLFCQSSQLKPDSDQGMEYIQNDKSHLQLISFTIPQRSDEEEQPTKSETQFLYQTPSTTSSVRNAETHISLYKDPMTTSTNLSSKILLSAACRRDSRPTLWKSSLGLCILIAAKTFQQCKT